MRNKNLEIKLIMLCNEIFDFLYISGNDPDILHITDILHINMLNMGLGTLRIEKNSVKIQEEISIGKYQIRYKWEEDKLIQVSLYHPKYSVLYSKSISGQVREISL